MKRNSEARPLGELARIFLKLGVIGFGGPAAHTALMEREFVQKRKWLSREEFMDLMGATQLIPGPNSTELAIHIGYRRCGVKGLWVAGVCFILPAAILVSILASAYVSVGKLPEVSGILSLLRPVILAIIVHALVGLGKAAVKSKELALLAALLLGARFFGLNEFVVIFLGGFMSWTVGRWHSIRPSQSLGLSLDPSLLGIFYLFLKIGSVLFGSGYVLLAFLRSELVERLGWLTDSQLMDAMTVGQVTPGPVFTTVTFIGYLLKGSGGAVLATVGIFLPAFVFVLLSIPLLERLKTSINMRLILNGVNVASWVLMMGVAWELAQSAILDWKSGLIFGVALWIFKPL